MSAPIPSPRLQRLRDAGFKITNARATVLTVMEEGGHLTSAEVVDRVAQRDPAVGRASVFRTLELLSRLSLIRPTYVDGSGAPVFVLLPNGHHHHIVCTRCGKVIDFHDCGLETLAAELEHSNHVRIFGHLLEFYGICAACEAMAAAAAEG